MNKQEVLVAVLEEVRSWEADHEEVRATEVEHVLGVLFNAVHDLDVILATEAGEGSERLKEKARQRMTTIAAAAVWLLTDEVTVVEGRSLDAWLRDKTDALTLTHISSGPFKDLVVWGPPTPTLPQAPDA